MKLLITGGCGYIGYSLIQSILNTNNATEDIILYDNLSRGVYSFFTGQTYNTKKLHFIKGELLDGRSLQKAMADVDVVVHLAAKVISPYTISGHEAHYFDQINHWGAANLGYALEESNVQQIIYLSSWSVYGHTEAPVDETYTPRPSTFYGISKHNGEKQINRLSNKLKVQIIRSGNVYGYNPVLRMDSIINNFMFEANFLGRVRINGNGNQGRSFISVQKLAYMINELIRNQEIPAGTYNLAEFNMNINQIAGQMRDLYPNLETLYVNENMDILQTIVKIPCKLTEYISIPEKSFVDELVEFKNSFSF